VRLRERTALHLFFVFLLALLPLVHCLGNLSTARAQTTKPQAGSTKKQQATQASPAPKQAANTGLPQPVQDMREAMLEAVRSGNIEDLRHAFELNELKPELGPGFGAGGASDPVAYWKKISGDGEGREILAALAQILDMDHAVQPLGRDIENNRVFIWPYLAEIPLAKLTPAQQVDLLRLVPPAAAREMKAGGKYAYWRLVIGADGTWHSLLKSP
jgi:hypothetical protein